LLKFTATLKKLVELSSVILKLRKSIPSLYKKAILIKNRKLNNTNVVRVNSSFFSERIFL